MIWGLIFCVGRMLLEVFSPFIVFGILFICQNKVEWWELVWHKHTILWVTICEALLTQDKLMSYGFIVFSMVFVLNVSFLLGSILGQYYFMALSFRWR
jgi:hypothetical protein